MLFHYAYIPFEIEPNLSLSPWFNWLIESHRAVGGFNSWVGATSLGKLYPFLKVTGLFVAMYGVYRAASGRIYLNGYWAIDIYDYGSHNKLITSGPYNYVRHPIYGGQNLLVSGSAMVSGSIVIYIFFLLVFFLNRARSIVEEIELLDMFGPEYEEYKKGTYFMIDRFY